MFCEFGCGQKLYDVHGARPQKPGAVLTFQMHRVLKLQLASSWYPPQGFSPQAVPFHAHAGILLHLQAVVCVGHWFRKHVVPDHTQP